jgi:hypothetical protein
LAEFCDESALLIRKLAETGDFLLDFQGEKRDLQRTEESDGKRLHVGAPGVGAEMFLGGAKVEKGEQE